MKIAKIFENQNEVLDEGKVDEEKFNKVKQMRNVIEEMMGDTRARSTEKEKKRPKKIVTKKLGDKKTEKSVEKTALDSWLIREKGEMSKIVPNYYMTIRKEELREIVK